VLKLLDVEYMTGVHMAYRPSFRVLLPVILLLASACLTVEGADTVPPNVTGVRVLVIGETWFTVEWTTDEPSLGGVQYGRDLVYDRWANETGAPSTQHFVNVTGLSRDTIYDFRVFSKDDSNNTGYGPAMSVGTTGGDDAGQGGKVATALFIAIPLALASALVYYHHLRRMRRRGRELPPE